MITTSLTSRIPKDLLNLTERSVPVCSLRPSWQIAPEHLYICAPLKIEVTKVDPRTPSLRRAWLGPCMNSGVSRFAESINRNADRYNSLSRQSRKNYRKEVSDARAKDTNHHCLFDIMRHDLVVQEHGALYQNGESKSDGKACRTAPSCTGPRLQA